jgi:hypothetical protein
MSSWPKCMDCSICQHSVGDGECPSLTEWVEAHDRELARVENTECLALVAA